jgi:tRNA modification GTPase
MESADIILGVIDASEPLHEGDRELLEKIEGKNALLVLNKCDLEKKVGESPQGFKSVEVSAKTGLGLEGLREMIFQSCVKTPSALSEGLVVTSMRHRLSLDKAADRMQAALIAIDEGKPLEIVAMEMREALDALGEIVGAVTTEDILDRIFSEFCIGK